MTSEILQVAKEGPIDWVTLNRPERLNALNPTLVDEVLDYFQSLYFDHSVRIVVLKGQAVRSVPASTSRSIPIATIRRSPVSVVLRKACARSDASPRS